MSYLLCCSYNGLLGHLMSVNSDPLDLVVYKVSLLPV
uniref:Uncharacterized protein n=1 Tax=Arundo donax TaxID=35708 RepID=A0A0A9GQS4_ARUDO